MASFLEFWGKARALPDAVHAWHPAVCHCLDVASVAEALLHANATVAERIAARCGWRAEDFIRAVVFLIALHDTGKFSRVFQALASDHWPVSLRGSPQKIPGIRHDALGFAMLTTDDGILEVLFQLFGGWTQQDIKLFLGAVAGHHGRPVPVVDIQPYMVCQECSAAARCFVEAMAELIEPPRLSPPPAGLAERATWWLAGLTTLCDWIGSSTTWFPYVGDSARTVADYWPIARRQAQTALAESGLLPVMPGALRSFHDLFPFIDGVPTPMQSLAETAPLPAGPICIIIEDATGGGKTEAALMLAHRLIAKGRAEGLFVALPTMVTADAMFGRLAESYRALFARETNPSLALAHGRAMLNTLFRGSILAAAATAPGDETADAAETASAQCSAFPERYW